MRIAGANGRRGQRRQVINDREAGARRRQARARQGRRGHADRHRGIPGLPRGRFVPDPPAIAARREVRRVQAHPAAGGRVAGAAAARGDRRRPAGRGRAPAAAGVERQGGRPRPGQQHHARAVRGPLPADPQRRSAPGSPPAADELAQVVDRADPALRETNRVLAILARQNHALAELARNGDAVLDAAGPRPRADRAASSTARRRPARRRRSARRISRPTSRCCRRRCARCERRWSELKQFSEAGTPTFQDLAAAAPAATRATKALGPFADAADTALDLARQAAAKSQAPLVSSDPLIRQVRKLAKSAAPATQKLSALLSSLDERGGFRNLLRFVYRGGRRVQRLRRHRSLPRAFLLITNCNDYVTAPQTGCIANFLPPTTTDESAKEKHAGAPRRPAAPAPRALDDLRRPRERNGGAQTETGPRSDQRTSPQQPQGQGNNGGQEAPPPLQTEPDPADPAADDRRRRTTAPSPPPPTSASTRARRRGRRRCVTPAC